MKNSWFALVCTLVLSISIWHFPAGIYAQSQSLNSSDNGKSIVSVSASVTVQVSNESLKAKDSMLKSSIIGFLNSGPNVLKTAQTDQPNVKSKISNAINNATQDIQGIEATNAIIGVEISKALKSLVSSSQPNQSALVTIQTSSTCKPSGAVSISCQNTVNIK